MMHLRVTNREQAKLLIDRLCAAVAQGKVSRNVVRRVYIQRSAFSTFSLRKACSKFGRTLQCKSRVLFQSWISYLKPAGSGAVPSVVAFALAGVIALSFCSLNGEKRRLEAERNQLAAENAQLNTDVDNLTETVDKETAEREAAEEDLKDVKNELNDFKQNYANEYKELLEEAIGTLPSRSTSKSAATTQIAKIREAIEVLLMDSDPTEADALLAKLEQQEASINWKYDHYPDYYPTYGTFTSPYGWRRDPFTQAYTVFHEGVDIANGVGTPIFASASGTVVAVQWEGGYGLNVVIDHGNGYKTRYAHLSKALVSVGDQVTKADKIALMGATGRVTGSHLHFEVIVNNQTQDPMKYIGG